MPVAKVRCSGCRAYQPRDEMRKVGLGYVCGADCVELVRGRARGRHQRRQETRGRRHSVHGPSAAMKRRVRSRDGDRCRYCGTTEGLHVHHIEYRSEGGLHAMTNLVTVCLAHHDLIHSNKRVYQPLCRAYIWMLYVEGQSLMLPQLQRWLRQEGCTP